MIWFAQTIPAPTTNLGDYALGVFGAYALAMFILVAIIVWLMRDRKELKQQVKDQQTENKALLESKVQDAKDFAKLDAQPTKELERFVKVLYDLYTSSSNKPEHK